MSLVAVSTIFAMIAVLSGIMAVGNGKHWDFTVADYFRGKRNAILFLWVISSTIFSILHAGAQMDYGIRYDWGYPDSDQWHFYWFCLHAIMSMLLTGAHIFVASTLSKEPGPVDKYLWGKKWFCQ